MGCNPLVYCVKDIDHDALHSEADRLQKKHGQVGSANFSLVRLVGAPRSPPSSGTAAVRKNKMRNCAACFAKPAHVDGLVPLWELEHLTKNCQSPRTWARQPFQPSARYWPPRSIVGRGGVIQLFVGCLPVSNAFADHATRSKTSSTVPSVSWDFFTTVKTKRLATVVPVPSNEFQVNR